MSSFAWRRRAARAAQGTARAVARFVRDAWTVCWLSVKLLVLVAHGSPMWMLMVIKLICFSVAMAPALADSIWYWLRRVRKNEPYGPGLRHLCDIYEVKSERRNLRPVVIFVTGGAWVIGYKAWAVPLGRALSAQGIVVIAPDYRNCPQAKVDGMLDDIDLAVAWTLRNVQRFGGDPNRIILAGQSAGAHLCALLLLRKAEKRAAARVAEAEEEEEERWPADAVRGFVGISGPYHLQATAVHWRARGLNSAVFEWVFGDDLRTHSPTDECLRIRRRLNHFSQKKRHPGVDQEDDEAALSASSCLCLAGDFDAGTHPTTGSLSAFGRALPPVCLCHGTADQSAPSVASELLEARLTLLGACVKPTKIYEDWTHTDPILEKPFAGDQTLHRDIHALVREWTTSTTTKATKTNGTRKRPKSQRDPYADVDDDDDDLPPFDATHCRDCRRLAPQLCIDFARLCMPF